MKSEKAAFIILHCQNDIVDPNGLYSASGAYKQMKKNNTLSVIAETADFCRENGIQVFYINNEYTEGYPELGESNLPICIASREAHAFLHGTWGVQNPDMIKPQKQDIVMRNVNTSAFSYTNLDQILRAKKISDLFLAGCATNFVVDSTARYGAELGYNTHVVEDCCESWTQEMHDFEIKYILPQFGTVLSSMEMKMLF